MRKRIVIFFLTVCMLLAMADPSAMPVSAATGLPDAVYLAQEGASTCTLSAAAMMLRARMYLSGNADWMNVTESAIKSIAWNSGLRWSFTYSTGGSTMTVARAAVSGGMTAAQLKTILDSHPEGIVLYVRDLPHAVFVTDYEGDTFYCADPASNYSGKRIPLASSYPGKKLGGQAAVLNAADDCWYVSSYNIPASPASHLPVGAVEAVSVGTCKVILQGWAFDEDDVGRKVTVQVFIGDTLIGTAVADGRREDIGSAYGAGDDHGFAVECAVPANKTGRQTLLVYAADQETGDSTRLLQDDAEIVVDIPADTQPPVISNIKVDLVDSTGYTVSCTVTDDTGVGRVQFPTWTAPQQDDLAPDWGTSPAHSGIKNGDTYTFRVDISAHNNEKTGYITHIYAWDNYGNSSAAGVEGEITVADTVTRIYGSSRYETSFKIAAEYKSVLGVEKFGSIIVASGENFPDALAGSYLAAVKNAPIIMARVKNGALLNGAELKTYIEANLAPGGTVYVLGGNTAIPYTLETELAGLPLTRLEGRSRYDTNLLILNEAGITGDTLLVCTGKDYADALSASATGLPILLVDGEGTLRAEQKEFIEQHDFSNIYILGGPVAVNESYDAALAELGGTVTRLAGASRRATSVLVAETFFTNPTAAVIAYSDNFPDGLCGGPLANALGAPVLLTKTAIPTEAITYAQQNGIVAGYVLGGSGLVSDDAVKAILNTRTVAVR